MSPTLPIQTQKVEDIQKGQLAAELSVAQNQEEQIVRLAEDVGHAKDIMTTLNGMVQVGFTNPAVNIKIRQLKPATTSFLTVSIQYLGRYVTQKSMKQPGYS